MIVYVGCYAGDRQMAARVAQMARDSDGVHEVWMVSRDDDGTMIARRGDELVGKFGTSLVSTRGWPYGCSSMFKQFALSLPEGSTFLNLEPDAVLTRRTSLNELAAAMASLRQRHPRVCVLAHWKTPPLTPRAPHEHYSGSAVYHITPEFRRALVRVAVDRPWDLDLCFRGLVRPDMGNDTPLIRCFWRQDLDANILTEYPAAALIHGDKRGVLLGHVESTVFGTQHADRSEQPAAA